MEIIKLIENIWENISHLSIVLVWECDHNCQKSTYRRKCECRIGSLEAGDAIEIVDDVLNYTKANKRLDR